MSIPGRYPGRSSKLVPGPEIVDLPLRNSESVTLDEELVTSLLHLCLILTDAGRCCLSD